LQPVVSTEALQLCSGERAAESLQSSPRDEKLYRALYRTYLHPSTNGQLSYWIYPLARLDAISKLVSKQISCGNGKSGRNKEQKNERLQRFLR